MRALLLDLGGVLITGIWPSAAADWASRLRMSPQSFMDALFAGNDDTVLIGRVTEDDWWETIGERLVVDAQRADEIRTDLIARERWDESLVAELPRLRRLAKIAVVSNAWPSTRSRLDAAPAAELVDEVVLSCEVGVAKPDAAIFELTLERLAVAPSEALFIDDSPDDVEAALARGLHGHVHVDTALTLAAIHRFLRD